MAARWDSLPAGMAGRVKEPSRRRPVARGRYRCRRCGEVLDCTWAKAERHMDTHGGGRIELILEPMETTT